jgi:hypothetical protein
MRVGSQPSAFSDQRGPRTAQGRRLIVARTDHMAQYKSKRLLGRPAELRNLGIMLRILLAGNARRVRRW